MFEQHPAVYEMIERVHDSLCCYRDLRARYRSRAYRAAPAVTASASPPATASAPAAPAPPTASPPPAATVTRSESTPRSSVTHAAKEEATRTADPPPPTAGAPGLDDSLIVGYRMHKGRMVPVFGETDALAEKPGGADGGSGVPNKETSATPASPPPPATTCPTPDPSSSPSPAAHTAAAPRAQHPPATLSLDPPTPPAIVREVDSPIERVLAEHRALLAEQARAAEERQATMLRDLLAEHRQSLAAAEDRHRAELAEVLAQHRAELKDVSARREDDTKAIETLRELLAELAENSCEQNACLGETVANLVDAVSRIALSREKPRAPTFIPPPLRVVEAPSITHPVADSRTDEASPATSAPAPSISQPSAPTRSSSPPANPVPPAKPAALATAPPNATPTRPSPEAVTVQAPPPPATRPRTGDLSQKATSILALVTELSVPPPTRQELRAQEQARERQHMQDLISDCEDDLEFLAECEAAVDEPDVVEAPRA